MFFLYLFVLVEDEGQKSFYHQKKEEKTLDQRLFFR